MNYFFAKILNRINLLKHINFEVPRLVNDAHFKIPVLMGLGFENLNISELWMSQLISKLKTIKKGIFIDVGVNVGQTLIKLRSIDADMPYIGFEPNPSCIHYSNYLIKINRLNNCDIIPVGLHNNCGILKLNMYTEGVTDSSASMVDNFRPEQRVFDSMYVPVNSFDQVNMILKIDEISIVKIDVEGAELEVLASFKKALSVFRPMIILEILPCYSDEKILRIERQKKVEEIISDLSYKFIRIIKGEDGKSIDKYEILESIGIHGNMEWCDYVVVPAEFCGYFIKGGNEKN